MMMSLRRKYIPLSSLNYYWTTFFRRYDKRAMRNALVRFGRSGMRNALVRFGKRATIDDIPYIPDYAEAKRNGAPQPFGKE